MARNLNSWTIRPVQLTRWGWGIDAAVAPRFGAGRISGVTSGLGRSASGSGGASAELSIAGASGAKSELQQKAFEDAVKLIKAARVSMINFSSPRELPFRTRRAWTPALKLTVRATY